MRDYMICSQERSGTHFLQGLLNHLKVSSPGELLRLVR